MCSSCSHFINHLVNFKSTILARVYSHFHQWFNIWTTCHNTRDSYKLTNVRSFHLPNCKWSSFRRCLNIKLTAIQSRWHVRTVTSHITNFCNYNYSITTNSRKSTEANLTNSAWFQEASSEVDQNRQHLPLLHQISESSICHGHHPWRPR